MTINGTTKRRDIVIFKVDGSSSRSNKYRSTSLKSQHGIVEKGKLAADSKASTLNASWFPGQMHKMIHFKASCMRTYYHSRNRGNDRQEEQSLCKTERNVRECLTQQSLHSNMYRASKYILQS